MTKYVAYILILRYSVFVSFSFIFTSFMIIRWITVNT